MKLGVSAAAVVVLTVCWPAAAQDAPACPAPGKCVSAEQKQKILQAMDELDNIHRSPAVVTLQDDVVIVRDWQDRVYVNGGDIVPLRAKLKIGRHVDRDLHIVLRPQLQFRAQPPDPMFRLRIRAQAGLLVPQAVSSVAGDAQPFWDGGVSWDFFHLGPVNLAAYTGVRSAGAGPGLDLTKNFGLSASYAFIYDGSKSSAMLSAYFSFN